MTTNRMIWFIESVETRHWKKYPHTGTANGLLLDWIACLTVSNHRTLLQQFITMELTNWSSLCENFDAELRHGVPDAPATGVFSHDTDSGNERWKMFHRRVVEHVR